MTQQPAIPLSQPNSFGGSYEHELLIGDYVRRIGGKVKAENGRLVPNDLPTLVASLAIAMAPYRHPALDDAAQGTDGLTDGKTLLLNQGALERETQQARVQGFSGVEAADEWFATCLKAGLEATPNSPVRVVTPAQMAAILEPILAGRPDWKESLGYDDARLEQVPALNALAQLGPDGTGSVTAPLGTGDYVAPLLEKTLATYLGPSKAPASLAGLNLAATVAPIVEHARGIGESLSSNQLPTYLVGALHEAFGGFSTGLTRNKKESLDHSERQDVVNAMMDHPDSSNTLRQAVIDVISGWSLHASWESDLGRQLGRGNEPASPRKRKMA